MQCAEALRVQAYFDGETDALVAGEVAWHLEHCAECRALLDDLQVVRQTMRSEAAFHTAPAEMRRRVLRALDDEEELATPPAAITGKPAAAGGHGFWAGVSSGVGVSALAAALVFFMSAPLQSTSLPSELVDAHLRSLLPDHLIAVVSTDRHTVKPWFAGRADVSPTVADFAADGYPLLGGRADSVERQRAAVTVYRHGPHLINVFSWVGGAALPPDTLRNGYRLAFWRSGNVAYCAVSDTGWDELHQLEALLRAADARENKMATAE